jgi:invasion protein IalB
LNLRTGDLTWIYRIAPAIMPAMQQERDMVSIRRRWLLAVHAAAGIAALSCAAHAQDGVAAWRVECTGDGKMLDCRAVQQLFQRIPSQGDRLLVAVLVRRPADPKAPAQMTMQLPLGLNLTEAVQMKVDGGPVERQPIQTCTNIGCFVSMSINDKLIASMRTGKDLKVTVQGSDKKPVEMSLPLLGFGLAFDRVKP